METRLVEALRMPVIQKLWTLENLEKVLVQAIITSALDCYRYNKGIIFTALSGGLDSSFALAVIRKKFGENLPIHTFTIGSSFDHPDIKYARLVAEKFWTHQHTVIVKNDFREIKKNNPALFSNEPGETDGAGPYFLLQEVSSCAKTLGITGISGLIVHDGIDELLGGYWAHRDKENHQDMEDAFKLLWSKLEDKHLVPLHRKADYFKIKLFFPYLQPEVIEYISRIPVEERTSRRASKIPLRLIADNGVYMTAKIAKPIINRPKIGFCDALTSAAELEKRT